jgi:hypothetical protein
VMPYDAAVFGLQRSQQTAVYSSSLCATRWAACWFALEPKPLLPILFGGTEGKELMLGTFL